MTRPIFFFCIKSRQTQREDSNPDVLKNGQWCMENCVTFFRFQPSSLCIMRSSKRQSSSLFFLIICWKKWEKMPWGKWKHKILHIPFCRWDGCYQRTVLLLWAKYIAASLSLRTDHLLAHFFQHYKSKMFTMGNFGEIYLASLSTQVLSTEILMRS